MQQILQFQVSATQKLWGVVHTPDDLATNPEPCALWMNCHGRGESGNTQESAKKVIGYSPLNFATGSEFKFKSPADGKEHRFIVVALQHWDWSPSPSQVKYCIENDLFLRYKDKINRNAIFIAGLSAGGQTTLDSITTPGIMDIYAAAVPMSPANAGQLSNIQATANNKIETWGFSGVTDGNFTTNLNNFSKTLNGVAKDTARVTIYPSGHDSWDKFFDPAYEEDFNGHKLNIYEWCLANMKGSSWVNPAKNLIVTAEFDFTYSNGVITLDASKSQNATLAWDGYNWNIQPKPGASYNYEIPGGAYGTPKTVNKASGDYDITLTVKDVFGTKASTKKIVSPGAMSQQPPTTAPRIAHEFIIDGAKYTLYDDGKWK